MKAILDDGKGGYCIKDESKAVWDEYPDHSYRVDLYSYNGKWKHEKTERLLNREFLKFYIFTCFGQKISS